MFSIRVHLSLNMAPLFLSHNVETLFEISSYPNPVMFEMIAIISQVHIRPVKDYELANWKGFKEEINRRLQINRNLPTAVNIEEETNMVTKISRKSYIGEEKKGTDAIISRRK